MAAGNVDTAGQHLEEVSQRYREQHPEVSTSIEGLQEILANVHTFIERLEDSI